MTCGAEVHNARAGPYNRTWSPFSDPIAEGPVIQAASIRALSGGATFAGIFDMIKRIRKKTDIPLVLMLYLNSIFGFGTERFFEICGEIGIDGVIVPDMPYEEKEEIQPFADNHNIISISLVTPTSKDRIQKIASSAKGFVYCVSSTGVTGMRSSFHTDFSRFISDIRKYTDKPCAIGFGISNAQQAHEIKKFCDGVIVGSAVVDIIGENSKNCAKPVYKFTSSLRKASRRIGRSALWERAHQKFLIYEIYTITNQAIHLQEA